jgi:hypothetical protein
MTSTPGLAGHDFVGLDVGLLGEDASKRPCGTKSARAPGPRNTAPAGEATVLTESLPVTRRICDFSGWPPTSVLRSLSGPTNTFPLPLSLSQALVPKLRISGTCASRAQGGIQVEARETLASDDTQSSAPSATCACLPMGASMPACQTGSRSREPALSAAELMTESWSLQFEWAPDCPP